MSLDSSCKTCEFNFSGTCAGKYYGEEIDSSDSAKECWSESLNYFEKVIKMLPEHESIFFAQAENNTTLNDLIYRLNNGTLSAITFRT